MIMRLIVSLLLLCHFTAYSQSSLQPIEIGQKIPSGLLDDYKGKLVILDFWSTVCVPCIASMPKMESLQKRFDDRLQIILITQNDSSAVENLFKKIKKKKPALPSIVEDSLFSKLFPFNSVPHHVWIDSTGHVLFITDGYNADEKNISKVLAGEKIDVAYKKQFTDFDRTASLLKEGGGRLLTNLRYYSVLFGHISEYGRGSGQIIDDPESKSSGLKFINMPMIMLYKMAFGESLSPIDFNNDNRVILEVSDKKRFMVPSESSELHNWKSENVFCYESNISASNKKDVFIRLQNDLNHYLPYRANITDRKVKCLVLVKLSSVDKIKSSGGLSLYEETPEDGLHVRNQPIKSSLLMTLKVHNYHLSMPIVDKTNYYDNIDIDITSKLDDIKGVRKELRKYNLDLIEKKLSIPMLVIKDRE